MRKVIAPILLSFFVAIPALAYETDQFSVMFHDLKDSTDQLDKIVNDGLDDIVVNWRSERDDEKLLKKIYKKFSSREFERWVNDAPLIDSRNARNESIYKTTGLFNSPIIRVMGLASTVNVNGTYIGADKLSHFFGVGQEYYRKSLGHKKESLEKQEQAAINWGLWTEHAYWGRSTTRVFSNADLVANFEGYQFYRSLFTDDVVKGKKAIFTWDGDRPRMQRKFSLRDHVNDYWSEALNPSHYYGSTRTKAVNVMRTFCSRPEYLSNPERFQAKDEQQLEQKYSKLRFNRDKQRITLNGVCRRFERWPEAQRKEFLEKEEALIADYHDVYKNDLARYSDRSSNVMDLVMKLPGCKKETRRGVAEHSKMLSWNEEVTDLIGIRLRDNLMNSISQVRELQVNGSSDRVSNELAILQLYGASLSLNIGDRNSIDTGAESYSVSGTFNTAKNGLIPVSISHKNIGGGKDLFCHSTSVAGLDMNGNYDKTTEIKITKCQILDETNYVQEVESSYALRNRFRSRTSQPGYYDITDQVGFVYRSISDTCKWY